jgi:hypothetical protein
MQILEHQLSGTILVPLSVEKLGVKYRIRHTPLWQDIWNGSCKIDEENDLSRDLQKRSIHCWEKDRINIKKYLAYMVQRFNNNAREKNLTFAQLFGNENLKGRFRMVEVCVRLLTATIRKLT